MRLVAVKRDALVVPGLAGLGVELGLVGGGGAVLCRGVLIGACHTETNVRAGEVVAVFTGLVGVIPAGVARTAEEVLVVAGGNTDGFLERCRQQVLELLRLYGVLRLPDGVGDLRHRGRHGLFDRRAEVFPQHAVPAFGREVAAASSRVVGVALVLVAKFCKLSECFLALVELPVGGDLNLYRSEVFRHRFDGSDLVAESLDAAVGDDEVTRSTGDVVRFFTSLQGHALAWVDGVVNLGVVVVLAVADDPPAHAGGSRCSRTTRQGEPHGNHCGHQEGNLACTFLHCSP